MMLACVTLCWPNTAQTHQEKKKWHGYHAGITPRHATAAATAVAVVVALPSRKKPFEQLVIEIKCKLYKNVRKVQRTTQQ